MQYLWGDIDATSENKLQCTDHNGALGGLGNIAESPKIESPRNALSIFERRQHNDSDGTITRAQLSKHREPVPVGQAQIEKDEIEISVLLCEPHGFVEARRL